MRSQVNFIVIAGMIALTIIALLNEYNFINQMAMASHIYISAQDTLLQSLLLRNYMIQQGLYKFELAEFVTALNGSYMSTNCGYINTSSEFPFIPVPRIYYWHNIQGQTCIPSNNAIENALVYLLSSPYFSAINDSQYAQNIKYYLVVNLTKVGNSYTGSVVIPPFNSSVTIKYYRSNNTFSIYNGSNLLINGNLFSTVSLNGFLYSIGPDDSVIDGALTSVASFNGLFKQMPQNIPVSLISAYTLINLPNGQPMIIFSTENSGIVQIYAIPIYYTNAETLKAASNNQAFLILSTSNWNSNGFNNGSFTFNGQIYNFSAYGNLSDIAFEIYPYNYAELSIQPKFLIYKYLIKYGQANQSSLLVPPSLGYIDIQTLPFGNAQVCISENGVGYSVKNCIPLAWNYNLINYLSIDLASAQNFINDTFPVGFGETIKGYPQYLLYNFLEYVTHMVNMRTVYYNGGPLYDWYANILLSTGQDLNDIKFTSEGYVVNSNQENLTAKQAVISALTNLFDYQGAATASFLSGTPYTIALYNLSVKAVDICNSNDYLSFTYTNSSPVSFAGSGTQYLPLPISFIFLYSGHLLLRPTIGCSNYPYMTSLQGCYPGFDYSLHLGQNTYTCCSPIIAAPYLNNVCTATIITNDTVLANYINQTTGNCNNVIYEGKKAIECYNINYTFNSPLTRYTQANTCPVDVSLQVNGQSYDFSVNFNTDHTFYGILYQFGGGTRSMEKSSIYNWSFGIYNKSISLSSNFTVEALMNISGIYPDAFVVLGEGSNLNSNLYGFNLNSYSGFDSYVNISGDNQIQIVQSQYNLVPNTLNNVIMSNNCVSGDCSLSIYDNGKQMTAPGLNSLGLLGISTYLYPTEIELKYLIAYSNYSSVFKGVTDYLTTWQFSRLSDYKQLITLSAAPVSNSTIINVVFLSQKSFPHEYLLKLPITPAFLPFLPNNTEIMGIWNTTNGLKSEPLYWYNLTPITPGSYIWINLTSTTPELLVIYYGNSLPKCNQFYPYEQCINYYNATKTFPVIIAPGIKSFSYSVNNITNPQGEYIYSNNNITLIKLGAIPPYVYSSNSSGYVNSTFACIHSNGEAQIMNVSYYAGSQYYDSQIRAYGYSEIYPGANLIGPILNTNINTGATGQLLFGSSYWSLRGGLHIYPT